MHSVSYKLRLICLVIVMAMALALIATGCGVGRKHPAPASVTVPAATVGASELQGTWAIATENGIDFPFYIGLTFSGTALTVDQGGCRDTGPYAIEGSIITWSVTWSVRTKGSDSSCLSDEDTLTLEDVEVSGDRLSFTTEGSTYVFKKK